MRARNVFTATSLGTADGLVHTIDTYVGANYTRCHRLVTAPVYYGPHTALTCLTCLTVRVRTPWWVWHQPELEHTP